MTPDQRRAEFDRLFTAIPGRNIDRLRKVAAILCCELNTIRIARLKTENCKPPTERNLKILRRELEREGIVQPAAESKAA